MTGNNPDLSVLKEGVDAAHEESPTSEQPEGNQPEASPEEEAFNKLSGSAQQRFRDLWRRAQTLEEQLDQAKEALIQRQPTAPTPAPTVSPDLNKAKEVIKSLNFMTQEDVDNRLNETLRRIEYNRVMENLEKELDGRDGRPQFSRDEYESFVKSNPKYQYYDPQDVYRIMYEDELDSWKIKQAPRQSTDSLKSGKPGLNKDEQWTPEFIEEKLKGPGGAAFYDKNKDKIEQVLRAMR